MGNAMTSLLNKLVRKDDVVIGVEGVDDVVKDVFENFEERN